jgi:hypothetical protein
MNYKNKLTVVSVMMSSFVLFTGGAVVRAVEPKPIPVSKVTASSSSGAYTPEKAVDGIINDDSRWVAKGAGSPMWIELKLDGPHKIAGLHLYSGYKNGAPVRQFVVQFWGDGKWQDVPSAVFENNWDTALAIAFDATVTVNTDRLRLLIKGESARVQEIMVWAGENGAIPPLAAGKGGGKAEVKDVVPLVYLNQSGFNAGKPKRFTAPTLADGTAFKVRAAKGGPALFEGKLKGNIGDFSAFEPKDDKEYVVEAGGVVSVPFRVGMWWLERVTYQNAVNFMIDSRHYVGNVRSKCVASFGWRDDCHFGWELNTLVPQYISNPSAYERMPRQITYEAPGAIKAWGALEPYSKDAPDIVKLIHWGADVIVTQNCTHEMLKGQLAYFLYAWPVLKKWMPEQNYKVVRDYAFKHWAEEACDRSYPYNTSSEHNLLAIKTRLGGTKGELPPGYSVEPNLLMYEVAKREGRADAETYLQAAIKQAEWMIANLDWNNPMVTKGQRMSEFITMTGLAHLQRQYPQSAPAGLIRKINEWAALIIRRSDNMWDFRKLDDKAFWTPMGDSPLKWNEPGNVVGLPAALLAALPVVTDPAVKNRFNELIWSHFDDFFGRNPCGRHFSYAAPSEIEGVEHGWYSRYPGGIGQLKNARFVIDGSPKDPLYPYHPEKGNVGWTEGWIQFNTPFNLSLAYLAHAESKITMTRQNDELIIRLEATLNFDYGKVETGAVELVGDSGDRETVTLTEESVNSRSFIGRMKVVSGKTPVQGNGVLEEAAGSGVEASYGFGYLGHRVKIK